MMFALTKKSDAIEDANAYSGFLSRDRHHVPLAKFSFPHKNCTPGSGVGPLGWIKYIAGLFYLSDRSG
jgi:hypothetical protein